MTERRRFAIRQVHDANPETLLDHSSQRASAANFNVILAVGRLDQGKQFDHLIAAFAMVSDKHPDWHLVILGDGPERSRLEAQAESLGISARVSLPGRAGNMAQWYQRASFFVLSSRFEGMPNALLEALAHGCPAVSYDCKTGPRDLIRDGVDGILVPPEGGVAALGGAIESMMCDEGMRQRMAAEAIAVRDRFAIGRILAKWEQLFDDK